MANDSSRLPGNRSDAVPYSSHLPGKQPLRDYGLITAALNSDNKTA